MAADSIDFRKFPQENGMWEFEPSYILSCHGAVEGAEDEETEQ